MMNRGARRQDIFVDDEARGIFLGVLAELPRFGVRIHGYALMPNHYHLLVESVAGELPRAMRHLGAEFSRRLNRLYQWDGPLFRGRYHNRLVGNSAYWRHLLVYVHQNPLRAGLDHANDTLWTSHNAYVGQAERPAWLHTQELQALYGDQGGYLEYFRLIDAGALPVPSDFDPNQLWAPHSTGAVAVPDLSVPLWRLADALEAVSSVTGKNIDEIITTPRGRKGNPANWLAAWWLSRHCGIDHGKIAAALGTSHASVSHRIARVQDRLASDAGLQAWATKLLALRPRRTRK